MRQAWPPQSQNGLWDLFVRQKSPKISVLEINSFQPWYDSPNFYEKLIFSILEHITPSKSRYLNAVEFKGPRPVQRGNGAAAEKPRTHGQTISWRGKQSWPLLDQALDQPVHGTLNFFTPNIELPDHMQGGIGQNPTFFPAEPKIPNSNPILTSIASDILSKKPLFALFLPAKKSGAASRRPG